MGTIGEQFIDSFSAYDEDGNIDKINIFKPIIENSTLQDPSGTLPGEPPRLRTEDGLSVTPIDIRACPQLIAEVKQMLPILAGHIINHVRQEHEREKGQER
jgi:hypothetical protein